jgi:hypothetical protein
MKYITVPYALTINPTPEVLDANPSAKPESMTFDKYARLCWLDDQRAIEGGYVKQVRWAVVVQKLQHAKGGDLVELEDEDYESLKAIVEMPTRWMPPMVMVQLLPFSQAVMDAPNAKPVTAS